MSRRKTVAERAADARNAPDADAALPNIPISQIELKEFSCFILWC